jgi:hypothetical protein
VIRFTEVEFAVTSSSPALTRLAYLSIQALYRAGHYFTPGSDAMITHLSRIMRQHGVQNVQTRAHALEYRADTPPGGQIFAEDMRIVYRTTVPFMRKWIRLPDDYEDIYQQALREMQAPDFVATLNVLTAWGNKYSLSRLP